MRLLRSLGAQSASEDGADPAPQTGALPAGSRGEGEPAGPAEGAEREEATSSSGDGSDSDDEGSSGSGTGSGEEIEEDEEEDDDEEDDDEEDEESDDGHDALEAHGPLWFLQGAHMGRARRSDMFAGCRRLSEVAPEPLSGEEQPIAAEVALRTAGAGPRHAPLLGRGCNPHPSRRRVGQRVGGGGAASNSPATQHQQQQQQQSPGASGVVTRSRAAAVTAPVGPTQQQQQQQQQESDPRVPSRRTSNPGGGNSSSQTAAGTTATAGGAGGPLGPPLGWLNTARLLAAREYGLARSAPGFGRSQQRHIMCERHLPVHARRVRDKLDSRGYIGQYSDDGRFFVAAFQDKRVRLYDTAPPGTSAAASSSSDPLRSYSSGGYGGSYNGGYGSGSGSYDGGSGGGGGGAGAAAAAARATARAGAHVSGGWRLRKDVTTRMTRWTITDTALSPDNRFLVYATIAPVAYMVHVGGPLDLVESLSNVTELHDALNFVPRREGAGASAADDDDGHWGSFGIWSVAWSPGGGEIIAGTNDRSVNVYDFETKRAVARMMAHSDDVNAVCYLDDSPSMIASGSDDATIKVWDRRLAPQNCRRPVGVLLGHTEGLTHLSARGDGRYLLSNCKDQTAKLWDVRAMRSPQEARDLPAASIPRRSFDYRWQAYPATGYEVRHPYDSSIQTYRGHRVLQTLIRAYFSPAHSTGQRYIYSGSSCGSVYIWDLVTARQVAVLRHHRAIVRDCSWHPHDPELATVSWDGTVVSWDAVPPGPSPADRAEAALRREAAAQGDRFDGYY